MSDPVLVSVHMVKCAGTSIRVFLEKSFHSGHRNLYPEPHSYVYTEEDLWRDALSDSAVKSLSSHFIRRFPSLIHGRPLLYFTFLRDPVQQFISYYSYIRKVFRHITDQELLASLPSDADALSSRDFAHWILTHPADITFRESYQTNFLARYVWMNAVNRGPLGQPGWPQQWKPEDWEDYCAARLTVAKAVLSRFFFVGTVESLEEDLAALRKRAARCGIVLPDAERVVENVTKEFRDDTGWIHSEDEVGKRLLESLREDFELYRFARALSGIDLGDEGRWITASSTMEKELAAVRANAESERLRREALEQSLSWRLTRPGRLLISALGPRHGAK